MTCHLVALCFDANDPLRLARFWVGVLAWEMAEDPRDGIALLPSEDTGFGIRFPPTQEQKTGQNPMHFDLTSTSLEDPAADGGDAARARRRTGVRRSPGAVRR